MKSFTCLLIPLSLAIIARAQSASQADLYAYQRSSTPGTLMRVTDEKTGKEIRQEKPRLTDWFIYLAWEGSAAPVPTCLWLEGKAYEVKAEKVSSPVILERPGLGNQTERDTLVPALRKPVWRLLPGKEILARKPGKTLADKDYVLLEWRRNGIRKKLLKAEIKKLPPMILQ